MPLEVFKHLKNEAKIKKLCHRITENKCKNTSKEFIKKNFLIPSFITFACQRFDNLSTNDQVIVILTKNGGCFSRNQIDSMLHTIFWRNSSALG
jgi:hypothetical protein